MPEPTWDLVAVGPVLGSATAAEVASKLVLFSVYFVCTPLPFDRYEFTVKREETHNVKRIIREVEDEPA